MRKLILSNTELSTLKQLVPKRIVEKLNNLELDCELIDLVEINEKVNGKQYETEKR